VVKDIQFRLNFRTENVFRKSFYRENLTYFVFNEDDKLKRLLQICMRTQGSGIVYVRSRRKTQEIADFLTKNNIFADFYHAGLDFQQREKKQTDWMKDKTRIIVATNAFGMGIDKSDVRFVVHIDIPDNLEAYFQEAGRAGRDEKQSYAILLCESSDIEELNKQFDASYPPIETIRDVYQALCNYFQIPLGNGEGATFDFDIQDFTHKYKFSSWIVFNSLNFIERAGFISISDAVNNSSKLHIPLSREDLYRFQVANVKYDNFVKLLLRSYSGLFSMFVSIDEKELARRANLSVTIIEQTLLQLSNKQIIIYQPQTENPQLTFVQSRVETRHLSFSQQVYNDRKKTAQSRLNTVIHYATTHTKCRNKLLLEYFNEIQPIRCGKCDVCLRRSEEDLTQAEFDALQKKILSILEKEHLDIDNLVKKLHYPESKILQVTRWLLDNEVIDKEMDRLRVGKRRK